MKRHAFVTLLALAAVRAPPAIAQTDTVVRGRDTVFVGPTKTCRLQTLPLELQFFRPADNIGVPEADVRTAAHFAIFTAGYAPAAWTPSLNDSTAHVRLEVDLWAKGGYSVQASLLPPRQIRPSQSAGSKGTFTSPTELGAIVFYYVARVLGPRAKPQC